MGERTRPGTGWALLRDETRGHGAALRRLTVWSTVEALPALVTGIAVSKALDDGYLASRPVAGTAWLAVVALALLVKALAARAVFAPLADVVEPLRDGLTRRLVTATVSRAAAVREGPDASAIAQLTGHIDTVRTLTSALLRSVLRMGLTVVMALGGAVSVSPVAGLIAGPPLVVAVFVLCRALPVMARRRHAAVLAGEAVSRCMGRFVAGMRDIAAAGASERAVADVREAAERHARALRAAASTDATRIAVIAVGCHLPMIALLLAAPWLLRGHLLTVGELIGAVLCLTKGIEPALRAVTSLLGAWGLQLGVVADRLRDVIDDGPATAAPCPRPTRPEGSDLALDDVTFAFGASATPVVRSFDLSIPHGEHLAIVGPSGIGKSTLVDLLSGLRPADSGTVRYGGVPLNRIRPDLLRREVTVIPQEAWLIPGTLRENLLYLAAAPDPHSLSECVDLFGLAPVIEAAGGLDASLAHRARSLSAGERQLIALGRAYLSPARVVILDEATSSLDAEVEARAESAFARRENTTLIVVAHRLASAARADRTVLLEGDQPLVAPHSDLLSMSALYAEAAEHWSVARVALPAARGSNALEAPPPPLGDDQGALP
ncbi:ATP-binding cassette domain-containing protein [Streptomyces sp. NPDC015492]|uniref:ATP-binding cassette domain-containing protein n=1 Tax=Streptomyces sp. NPDC015492 TaxID=3364958 RepID=UPI0036F9FD55